MAPGPIKSAARVLVPAFGRRSLELDANGADQLAVFLVAPAEAGGDLLPRGDVGLAGTGIGEPFLELGLEEDFTDRSAQPVDDRPRRAGRNEQAVPDQRLVARIELGDGWQF